MCIIKANTLKEQTRARTHVLRSQHTCAHTHTHKHKAYTTTHTHTQHPLHRRASSSPRTSGIFEFSTTPPSPKAVQQRQTNSFVRSPEEPRRNNSFIRSLFAKDKEKDVSSSQPLPEGLPRNNSFIKSLFAKDSSQHGSSSQHHTQPLPPTMSQSEGQQPFLLPLFARNSDYSAITQQQDMMSSAGYGGTHHLKSSTSPQVLFGGLMHQQGPVSGLCGCVCWVPKRVLAFWLCASVHEQEEGKPGFCSLILCAPICRPLHLLRSSSLLPWLGGTTMSRSPFKASFLHAPLQG